MMHPLPAFLAADPFFKQQQISLKKIIHRQSPTVEDRTIVALYEALEKKTVALRKLSLKVALLEAQEPTAQAGCEYTDLLKRLSR